MNQTLRRTFSAAMSAALAVSLGTTAIAASVTVEKDDDTTATVNGLDNGMCSWTEGGTDASDYPNGDDYSFTPVVYVADGALDAAASIAGEAEGITDTEMTDTEINVNKPSVNGIVINNSDYTISDSTVAVNAAEADGSATCDFSGLGSAVAVYGNSDVTIENTKITASGVADLALFVDNGATVLVNRSVLSSAGGTLYESYVNSPSQTTMAAPPWILGIMGNSRCLNLMGNDSTLTILDSDTSAALWAVLSTDSGSNMVMNVVNSTVELTGTDEPIQAGGAFDVENPYTERTGYGSYVIGGAAETFLGVRESVGTFASIFTGGTGYYGNLVKGQTYELLAADGSVHTTYTAEEDVQTVIDSDTFGFMVHQGTNELTLDGVQVNSVYADLLYKSGSSITVNVTGGAEINTENGILVQMIDNDDTTTSMDGASMAFGENHEEYAGFPTQAAKDADEDADKNADKDADENSDAGDAMNVGEEPKAGEAMNAGQAPADMPNAGEDQSMGQAPADMPNAGGAVNDGQSPADMPGAGGGMNPGENPKEGEAMGAGGPMGAGEEVMNAGDPTGAGEAMNAGGPMEEGSDSMEDPASADMDMSAAGELIYNVEDTALAGDLYNAVYWDANELSTGLKKSNLIVNLSGSSRLDGAIASTSAIHVTYEGKRYLLENGITAFDDEEEAAAFAEKYQNTDFPQSHYFDIGQVANLISYNGYNNVTVTVADDSVWTVTGTSLIQELNIEGNGQVIVEEGVQLTVGDEVYEAGTYTAEK